MNQERRLLFSVTKKDLKIEKFRGSGKGGQHRNTRDTAVRITHISSGAVGTSQDERSQAQNIKKAFERMANSDKFKEWHKIEAARHLGLIRDIDKIVNEQMREENLKMDYF